MKKKNIIIAFAMLLLTGVALSTASYAWFTANTRLTLGNIEVNVQAKNGIQISTDAVNWKGTLTTAEIKDATYTGHTNQFPTTLEPVSTVGPNGQTGVFDMYYGALNTDASIDLTSLNTEQAEAAGTSGRFVAFDLFIQATADDTAVGLVPGSGVSAAKVVGDSIVDAGLKKSIRIGFLNKGTDATNTPATAQALNTSTDYVIWEPNSEEHTDASTGTDEYVYTYIGAKGVCDNCAVTSATYFEGVTPAKLLLTNLADSPEGTVDPEVAKFTWATAIANNTAFSGTVWSTATNAGYPTVLTVNSGITKVRFYLWVEGQDIDCENNASLGSGVSVSIILNAKSTT